LARDFLLLRIIMLIVIHCFLGKRFFIAENNYADCYNLFSW